MTSSQTYPLKVMVVMCGSFGDWEEWCESRRNVDSAGPTPYSVPQFTVQGLREVRKGETPRGEKHHLKNPHPIKYTVQK